MENEMLSDFEGYNIKVVYAKGTYLERRVMSGVALNGEFMSKSDIRAHVKDYDDYSFIELNDNNIPKFPHKSHDALKECNYFLSQIKLKKL